MMALLTSAIGAAAGLAIVSLALVVVYDIDLRAGGAWWGLGWLAAAALGGSLFIQAVQAAMGAEAPGRLAVGLGTVFAVLGWRYRAMLRMESRKPAQIAQQRAEGL